MAEKTIMLICSAGMSTSLLVTKMQKAAEEIGLDYKIFATSATEADSKIENDIIDVIWISCVLLQRRMVSTDPAFTTQ